MVMFDPELVATLLSSVVNHRYVGSAAGRSDPLTEAILKVPSADPTYKSLMKERKEMSEIVCTEERKADELLFVTRSVVTRRFMKEVLLDPRRSRPFVDLVGGCECDAVVFVFALLTCLSLIALPGLHGDLSEGRHVGDLGGDEVGRVCHDDPPVWL